MQKTTYNANKEKSIAIIICYFGKFPWYFDLFIHSCSFNPSINFFIISDDQKYDGFIPSNVRLVNKTLTEINQIATERLGFNVNIINPYKLCDFKPTYGFLFNDLIRGYDFWGYADIDVVFGDIREFITNKLLNNHDIISVRHDFLTGYFQLLKNNHKMINLFKESKDHIKVLTSEKHYCFDETNFQFQAFSDLVPLNQINCEIESMMHVVRRLERKKYIKAYFDFHVIEGLPGKLKWINGKLFYRNKYEILLYHMILFKKVCKQMKCKTFTNSFNISPSNIY